MLFHHPEGAMSRNATTYLRAVVIPIAMLLLGLTTANIASAQIADIEFAAATSSGVESSDAAISITWTGGNLVGDLVLDISTAGTGGSPATAGADFTNVTTLTISGGSASPQPLPITVSDDVLDEDDEAILATITGVNSYGAAATLGAQVTHTYTINDNDATPSVSFAAATSNPSENAGPVTVTVSLSAVSGRDVSVPFTTAGSTATGSGTDYSISATPLTISAGQSSADITVTVVEDLIDEVDETVVIPMVTGSLVNATAGATTTHTLTIADNDLVVVTFDVASSTDDESNADQTIQINFDQNPAVAFNIQLSYAGTATGGGNDYTAVDPISSGTGSATLELSSLVVVDDAAIENQETVIISIDADAAYTQGGTLTHTFTIEDNDDKDFGDLPEVGAILTSFASGGARHTVLNANNPSLGGAPDLELDGTPGANADNDDTIGSNDEDGVETAQTDNAALVAGETITLVAGSTPVLEIDVQRNGASGVYLEVFLDYDGDGTIDETEGPTLISSDGTQSITLNSVPASEDFGFARFRVHQASGGVGLNGLAASGEVEDYTIDVLDYDFGDAPDPLASTAGQYPTLLINNGARHAFAAGDPALGPNAPDLEATGQPSVAADGDGADEDGVTQPAYVAAGVPMDWTVNLSTAIGDVDAWVDWDGDGVFEAGEQIANSVAMSVGNNTLSVTPPITSVSPTYARFRVSSAGGLNPEGPAADGEIEDYQVTIIGVDFGDAPANADTGFGADYPVLTADQGARHTVGSTVTHRLGALIDIDPDGQALLDALGDDADGTDDEDGLVFNAPIVVSAGAATSSSLTITTFGAGYLSAWIDFDQDAVWTNEATATGEEVISNLSTGTSSTLVTMDHVITIPAGASPGVSYLRVRFCSVSGECDEPTSATLATNGEVEDHQVTLTNGDIPFTPTVDMTDIAFDTIKIVGANTCFVDSSGPTNRFCVPTANLNAPVLTGTAGNDNLTVDFTVGDPIPGGLTFNAGSQTGTPGDMITLTGSPGVDVTHTFTNANDGTILIGTSLITYTGLEPVIDNLDPVNRVFTFTSAAATETITLGDDGSANDGISLIDSDAGESVTFTNPTGSMTINAGDGAQTLDLGLLDTSGAVLPNIAVVVNGDSEADTFNVTAEPTLGTNYASYTLNGGAPTTCTGDVFNQVGGTASTGLTLGAGVVTFTSAHQPISFTTMEVLGFAAVDVAITAGAFDDNPVFPGDDIVLTVTVTNDGAPADQAQCVLVDMSAFAPFLNDTSVPLPAAVASTGSYDQATNIWTLPTLDIGATETLTVTYVVDTQLSGDFGKTITSSNGNVDGDGTNDDFDVPLTVGTVFKFPAKAHAQSAVFKTLASGLERMVLGLYGGSPGINGAVWCRIPDPDGVVFTVVGMPTVYKTCADGLPNIAGTALPLFVNDLWLDETGTNAGRIYMTTWGSEGLYYSDDDGETWTAFEPDLSDGFGGAAGWVNVYAITEDATDGILYISANNGLVFRSLNDGSTWQQVSSLPEGSADTPWSLVSHPTTSGVLFAGTLGKGVYVSTDYGLSWAPTTDNATLIGAPNNAGYIFDLEMKEVGGADWLFAATSRGVWRTDFAAGAPTWDELDTDQEMITPTLVNPEIRSITFGADSDADGEIDLYAVSWGFGVLKNAKPFTAAAGDLVQFALRGADVTMFAVAPSGTIHIGTSDGAVYEMDPNNPVEGVATSNEANFDPSVIPEGYVLEQNYPNPFNPQTSIRFALPETGNVKIVVVDMLGRAISTLVDGPMQAGSHEVLFDASNLPSGTYIYRLEAEGVAVTRLLSLVK
jgi:GEVED domain/Calx-beta domain/Domain of unknown function DUF11/Secretion system C-terminal sorting domain